jgi:hypothetical protein
VVAIRSDGGLFQGNQIKPYYITKNQTIMKNSGEYDKITQTIEIPSDVVNQAKVQGNAEQFRKYLHTELAHKLAEKLMESGYITETWLRRERSEECTVTLYVKPLID